MEQLTNKERDLLIDMLSVYREHLDKKISTTSDFIALAHETGDIASAGKKYVDNRKFFDVKDNIRKHLESIKNEANQLILKINT